MLKETFTETINTEMTYEGTLRDYFKMPDGSFESRMYFSILKDE